MSDLVYTLDYSTLTAQNTQLGEGGAYGVGPYGTSPWGSAVLGGPPSLFAVSPSIVDVLGGTVIAIAGNNFNTTAEVSVLQNNQVVGYGVIALPDFDVTANKLLVGMPALDIGTYDLRVQTNNGSAMLIGAIEARDFAPELKAETARRKFGRAWSLGTRILSGG